MAGGVDGAAACGRPVNLAGLGVQPVALPDPPTA
jgi:hypothetical protein